MFSRPRLTLSKYFWDEDIEAIVDEYEVLQAAASSRRKAAVQELEAWKESRKQQIETIAKVG